MEEPEDKGPRYRVVMFFALAAIVIPGFLLLNWIGDNGVSKLFRSLVGLDQPRPRVTRTATPTAEATATFVATSTVVASPTATASAAAPPGRTPTASPTAPATPTALAPSPVATEVRPATATSTPEPPPPTPTLKPAPTATPLPEHLGYGTAVPAYGGAAVIRAEPTTDSAAIGSIPLDERVLVLRIVEGEAIDPVESRWWEVEYGGVRGFVYYKLIRLD